MKKAVIIVLIIAVLGVGGYFGSQFIQKNNASKMAESFQTVRVERGDLTALVGATGIVRSNQSAILAWETNGQIGEINVQLDDSVAADEILASLKQSSVNQSIILAAADLVAAQNALDDLLSSSLPRAQAQAALANAQEALDKASDRRESKDYKRASQNVVDQAYANYILAQDEASKWEQRYDTVDNRPAEDPERAAAFSAWAQAKQKLAQAEANWRYLLLEPDSLEIAIADGNLVLAQAQYDAALKEWERLKDGPDPDDIRAAEVRITSIESTIDSINLRAPFGGTITEVRSKIGDQVAPGTVSFRIDDLSHLLVDVQIPEVDINRIKVGMPTRITFDAILNQEYSGIVTEVARVGINVGGSVNFNVTIELSDADEQVLTGMTAAVNIIVSEIEDVIIIPNRAVRLQDGKRVVFVLKPGEITPQAVPVTIGASSDTYAEVISSEIKVGDILVLNPPTQFSPGGPMGGGF
jgi:HlyD family secretion protein